MPIWSNKYSTAVVSDKERVMRDMKIEMEVLVLDAGYPMLDIR